MGFDAGVIELQLIHVIGGVKVSITNLKNQRREGCVIPPFITEVKSRGLSRV